MNVSKKQINYSKFVFDKTEKNTFWNEGFKQSLISACKKNPQVNV